MNQNQNETTDYNLFSNLPENTETRNNSLSKTSDLQNNQVFSPQQKAASHFSDAAPPFPFPQNGNSVPNVQNVQNIAPVTQSAGALGTQNFSTAQTNSEMANTQNFQKLALAISSNPELRLGFLNLLSNPNNFASPQGGTPYTHTPMLTQADYYNQNPYSQQEGTYPQSCTNSTLPSQTSDFDSLCAQNNEFFNASEARLRLKDYLARFCGHLTQEELQPILNLAFELENSAVSKFQAQANHKGALHSANSKTLQKLQTQSSNPKPPTSTGNKTYSRSDIPGMTIDEFRTFHETVFPRHAKKNK